MADKQFAVFGPYLTEQGKSKLGVEVDDDKLDGLVWFGGEWYEDWRAFEDGRPMQSAPVQELPAAGPWQEGEPEEDGQYLVHYTHGTYTGYMTALFRGGKCVRPIVPPADSIKIHRHARINSPDA